VKLFGIALKEAGRPIEESKAVSPVDNYKPEIGEGRKTKKTYATIYGGKDVLPIDLEPYKAGDKLIFIAVVNIKSKADEDTDGKGKSDRFELEILKAGVTPFKKQKPSQMTDEELVENIRNGLKVEIEQE
jgi:hypothetical protein